MAGKVGNIISNILKKTLSEVKASLRRFPLAITSAFLASVLLIILNRISSHIDENTEKILTRIILCIILMVPLYLIIKIIDERIKIKSFFLYFIPPIISAVYFFTLLSDLVFREGLRYAVLLFFLITLFLIILNFKGKTFGIFTVDILKNFLITYIYSLILFGGLSGVFAMIDLLFEVNIDEKIYLDLLIVSLGIFGPIFYLSKIPKPDKDYALIEYPKVFKILLIYIVMPIILIYTTILSIYLIRTIFTGLPDGLIANLILWYAMISTFVVFLVYPFKEENRFVGFFSKYLPILLLPLNILLSIAIIIRIDLFGFTINRYYVVAGSIFIFASCIYLITRKKPKLIMLATLIGIISFISVIGPISTFSITSYSQNKIFTQTLKENDMLQNGNIVKNNDISEEDKQTIYSILRYFDRYLELENVKYIPNDFEIKDTENLFGFDPYRIDMPNSFIKNNYFNYSLSSPYADDITNYQYIFDFTTIYDELGEIIYDDIKCVYSNSNKTIHIYSKDELIYEKDFNPIIESIVENKDTDDYRLPAKDLTFLDQTSSIDILYVFTNISGSYLEDTDDDIDIDRLAFKVFIKIK